MNRCSGYNECMWEPRGACAQQTHRDIRASQKTSPPLTSHSPSCFHLSLGFFFTVRINRTTLVPFYFLYRCCCRFLFLFFFQLETNQQWWRGVIFFFTKSFMGLGWFPLVALLSSMSLCQILCLPKRDCARGLYGPTHYSYPIFFNENQWHGLT